MGHTSHDERRERWARLRFSIIGALLAAPPKRGELSTELRKLSSKLWEHPETSAPVRFGQSTIERWYYSARGEQSDPVGVLRRRVRKDAGRRTSLLPALQDALREQHREHSRWSYKLHADNLRALAKKKTELGKVPSTSTVRRYMKSQGLFRKKRRGGKDTEGALRAERRFESREVRSFEVEHVHGLWHLDFHSGSRRVLTSDGRWRKPALMGIIDDRSRLCCHLQWYLEESAESLVHALIQAIQKRGLPRALMSDNGAAMIAEETRDGLARLGIMHQPTLCYSPYQNGKQESFWNSVEGRLMAMLEGEEQLSLAHLNRATQAWVELDYNREHHSEIKTSPLARFLAGPAVGRRSPSGDELRRAFRRRVVRSQRRSDGTISLDGVRFELPTRFGHLERVVVRYARWDLGAVEMIDERSGTALARLMPLDKSKNADGLRRKRERVGNSKTSEEAARGRGGMAPLMRAMIEEYSASGFPPAYLPKRALEEREKGEVER